ncbi:MAG: hypothetical protein JWP89_1395 [Schlesneria sp.]|nr:hypothetical protein [Schlesneria sp.]
MPRLHPLRRALTLIKPLVAIAAVQQFHVRFMVCVTVVGGGMDAAAHTFCSQPAGAPLT